MHKVLQQKVIVCVFEKKICSCILKQNRNKTSLGLLSTLQKPIMLLYHPLQ